MPRSDRSPETPSTATPWTRTTRPDLRPPADPPGSHRHRRASPPDHGSPARGHDYRPATRLPTARSTPASTPSCQRPEPTTRCPRGHQPVSVRPHVYRDLAPSVRHLQGDPPESALRASATRRIPAQADSQAAPTIGAALFHERSGLSGLHRRHTRPDVPAMPVARPRDAPASDSSSPPHAPTASRRAVRRAGGSASQTLSTTERLGAQTGFKACLAPACRRYLARNRFAQSGAIRTR